MQKVFIVEDHLETREWLVSIVKESFDNPDIAEAGTVEKSYRWLEQNTPSLTLVDLSLPDGNGLDLIKYLNEHFPENYIVVTTIFDDDRHLFNALRAGASGYLLKDQPRRSMVESLSGIMSGKPPLSPAIARRMLRHFQQDSGASKETPLSEREAEVLTLLAKGMGRNDIADLLEVSVNTAASHIKSIYRKLNVSGRAEATLQAVKMGLVSSNIKNR
ncbi:MAG: response regulator transcription factor [Saccharospirillum sp.]|nr:response regulator transcription factor [Saccharospirillum sp.]